MQQGISSELIQTWLNTNGLIKLAPAGISATYPSPVVATKALCRNCCWSYPTAQPSDVFDVQALLSEVNDKILTELNSANANPRSLTIIPHQKPAWLQADFAIRVHILSPYWMVLALENEALPFEPKCSHLPARLVIKLLATTSRLSNVARQNDLHALTPLVSLVKSLADKHPLKVQIHAALAKDQTMKQVHGHLTRDEYRQLLLDELLQLLTLSSACGLPTKEGNKLGRHYDWLCSPLNELLHLTRSLLLFSVAIPHSAVHLSQFDDLLEVYAALRALVSKPNPKISKRLINQLRFHAYILSCLLSGKLQEELQQLEQGLAVLDSIADAFASGVSYPPQYYAFH